MFRSHFDDALKTIIEARGDEQQLALLMPYLADVALQSEWTYFYSQSVLWSLTTEPNSEIVLRISQLLDAAALRRIPKNSFVHAVRAKVQKQPDMVSQAIASIIDSSHLSAGDVLALHKAYTVPNPPPAIFIQDDRIVDKLLHAFFAPTLTQAGPHQSQSVRSDMRDKYFWVLARASVRDDELLKPTFEALKKLEESLSKTVKAQLFSNVDSILDGMKYQVCAGGLLLYIHTVLEDGTFYEMFYKMDQKPLPFLILEEIAYRHPPLRIAIFEEFTHNLEKQLVLRSPESVMSIRRQVMDSIVVFTHLGEYDMAFRYINKRIKDKDMDLGLATQFCKAILETTESPFAEFFLDLLAELIISIQDALLRTPGMDKLVIKFLNKVLKDQADLSEVTSDKLRILRSDFQD